MNTDLANRIVDTAVELSEQASWEALYLHQVAQSLNITLDELHRHYSVKDQLVEAWYDRADSAMLRAVEAPGFQQQTIRQRLDLLIMAWLDFLATHKTVSRDMLLYKLEPAHIHLQIQGVLRISRTVQWLREAARMNATHGQRIVEEFGLTGIFLNTFIYWMFDQSERQTDTRRFLDRKLARAERFSKIFFSQQTTGSAMPWVEDQADSTTNKQDVPTGP